MAGKQVARILVMSDSHGDRAIVEKIKNHYLGKVDALFHNGDSELKSDDPVWENVYVVEGNCDYYGGYPETKVIVLNGLTIAQTHGHLYGINFGWQRLDYWAEEQEADICLYGHLHIAAAEKRGDTLFVNPGSVLQPRGMIREKLYALITITEETYQVRFYDLNHQEYTALSEDFPR